jgi:hypothetical protein
MNEPEPEHTDPNRVPPWLMEAAKAEPLAMGWLVSGYVTGVQVGRISGPCGHVLAAPFGVTLVCVLAHGHPGAHQTAGPTTWTEAVPEAAEGASTP